MMRQGVEQLEALDVAVRRGRYADGPQGRVTGVGRRHRLPIGDAVHQLRPRFQPPVAADDFQDLPAQLQQRFAGQEMPEIQKSIPVGPVAQLLWFFQQRRRILESLTNPGW